MSFLKAEWRKLAIANYKIDPTLLEEYLPAGTELDFWEGNCYVSLIGFMFLDTRILGFRIPFHTNFEEVNLRFYVKRYENKAWKRGVVFIKEMVPKFALTFVANTIYKENYVTLPMKHRWEKSEKSNIVEYQWKKDHSWQKIKIIADLEPSEIIPDSETEFITEHYWGYAKVDSNTTNEYEVTHPKWLAYKVIDFDISVNFESVYGEKFAMLNGREADSVMLAEGSEITVENKKKLKF
ncbi:YqjF family protein [Portibacter lacus]|uniref:DUF2071 domain-containing protein n=1 Tax=Portibacter lacus TaxID=1099794 RepID=A0AA37SSQ8_9BACT|nr:DUF2071 domain-containing protein [Portibacter lacus]GLR19517.1 hypothetical protein GCM10007940_41330 [Portibacter lacus]